LKLGNKCYILFPYFHVNLYFPLFGGHKLLEDGGKFTFTNIFKIRSCMEQKSTAFLKEVRPAVRSTESSCDNEHFWRVSREGAGSMSWSFWRECPGIRLEYPEIGYLELRVIHSAYHAQNLSLSLATRYLTRPAQVGSRRGPVCKRDTVSSPVSFVVTREGLEGGVEDNWVVFRVCTLKNKVSEALCVSFSNVEILCSKTLTLLFKF
jgi:hypothetical protein